MRRQKITPSICLAVPLIVGVVFASPLIFELVDQWMNFNEFTIMVTPVLIIIILGILGAGLTVGFVCRALCRKFFQRMETEKNSNNKAIE